MEIDIDMGTGLTALGFLALGMITLYAMLRTIRVINDLVNREPELPDIAQIAKLKDATGFQVVDVEAHKALQEISAAVGDLPLRVTRLSEQLDALDRRTSTLQEELGESHNAISETRETVEAATLSTNQDIHQLVAGMKEGFDFLATLMGEEDGGNKAAIIRKL